jgi:hypothetical protein
MPLYSLSVFVVIMSDPSPGTSLCCVGRKRRKNLCHGNGLRFRSWTDESRGVANDRSVSYYVTPAKPGHAKKVRLRLNRTHFPSNTSLHNPANMNAIVIRHSNHLRSLCKPSSANSVRICLRATRSVNSMSQPVRPRRFAPLDPAKKKDGDERPLLKGIVFDVDGTLCTCFDVIHEECIHVLND